MEAICVYCSSSSKLDAAYFEAGRTLGRLIAERAGTLVFGGNCVGLMNAVAESVQEHGGRVVGITPRLMHDKGITYERADELVVTEDMRQRKAEMERRADAFVALPGGFGTLEELFEMLTHKHLGYHNKPIALLNTAEFYGPLVAMFEHIYRSRCAKEVYRGYYHVAATPEAVFDYLDSYVAPAGGDKWL